MNLLYEIFANNKSVEETCKGYEGESKLKNSTIINGYFIC